MNTTIYVVGPQTALKNNQWSVMTNDETEAKRMVSDETLGDCETYKAVEVRDNAQNRRRRNR